MSFRVETDVMVEMRDGVRLATDLWIPDDSPAATLLVRLPYSKDIFPAAEFDYPTMPNIFSLLDAGYAIVYQDCRGTSQSEGAFTPTVNEPADGVDTITWLRAQPWCDGRIGMFGHSYLGMTQWAAATAAPDGLLAIAPTVTTTDFYTAPWYSEGGALSWHAIWYWTNLMLMLPVNEVSSSSRGAERVVSDALALLEEAEHHLRHVPPAEQPLYAEVWPWWTEILQHSERDSYWRDQAPIERLHQVKTPALHVAGWYDIFVGNAALTFTRARQEAATPEARAGQRLVIGPWDHMHFSGEYLDRQFGIYSSVPAADLTQMHLDFFDRTIRGNANANDLPPVRIFVMGIDEWRDEQDWPLPDTQYTDYFMTSSSGANSCEGDGRLLVSPPMGESGEDVFVYDPDDPVPTLGGRMMQPASLNAVGPVDQRQVETRMDVLCFSTDVLEHAVEVTGPVSAVLHVTSSAVDTDFTAKLVDVFPDGRAIYLTDGITRARYRESLSKGSLMEPGEIYEISIDMLVTSNVFLPGHQIRVEISSSNFPRYDRNDNTGAVPAFAAHQARATNRVLHGPEHSSRLILPIIPPRTG